VKPILLLLGSPGPPTRIAKFLPAIEPDTHSTVLTVPLGDNAVSRRTNETVLPPPIRCLELVTASGAGLGHLSTFKHSLQTRYGFAVAHNQPEPLLPSPHNAK